MRRIVIGLIMCSLGLLACGGGAELRANNRVAEMMDGWQSGGTSSDGNIQEAIGRWYDGSRQLQLDYLKHARVEFDNWRREKSLYKEIDSWAITSITEEPGTEPPAMIVAVDIDGQGYQMRVTSDQPIEWVQ